MKNIAALKYKTVNDEVFAKYIKLKEELSNIKEDNKVKEEEKKLASWESLFAKIIGEVEEEETPTFEQFQLQFREDDDEEEEELQTKQEETVELPKEEEVIVIPVVEEEEPPAEEIILSGPDIAEEKTMADKVSKLITKQAPKVKEKVNPIQAKINKLEHRINELFNNAFGGGLDPNKISAHLIPTTANTFDLGSSDRPWRDVHLSGATLVIGGTELAAGELTVLDNITAGTVSASKAVIADSSKDITGFRNVNAVSYSINGTAIASTAAELNILDGVTSTTAELNLLDISTASGASSSTFLRGDGSWQAPSASGHTIQNAGSNLTTRASLNFDGTYVIGIDDSNNDQTDVTLHSTLQGLASVAATASELNIMDGVTSTTAELNLLDVSTASGASSSTFLRGDGSWQTVSGGEASLTFKTFSVSGQSDVIADSVTDTLTFVASGDATITTSAGSDSITIDSTVTSVDGGNF